MEKDAPYIPLDKSPQSQVVYEPEAVYHQASQLIESDLVWPLEEALKTGMALDESKRRILEMVHKHFHP